MRQRQESADLSTVRHHNTGLILRYLREDGAQTRATLASRTGLTRATVSSVVENLIAQNLVMETGIQEPSNGRPGTLLELNPKGAGVIGVEVQECFFLVVLADFASNVRWRKYVEMDCVEIDEAVPVIEKTIDEALDHCRSQQLPPRGIGVGLPGLVDITSGTLIIAPNLQWHNMPVKTYWEERFRLPVTVRNEAAAAALGEHYYGVARDYADFIYLDTSMLGLGGGIFLNGDLLAGSDGFGGEVGHMAVPGGTQCLCGRTGCWETVVSGNAILDRIRRELQGTKTSLIRELVSNDLTKLSLEVIARAADKGDLVATKELHFVSETMGAGIANLVNIFNPRLIVLGGPVGFAIKSFLPIIKMEVNEQLMYPLAQNLDIRASSLGKDTCVMGGIALILEQFQKTFAW